MKLRSRWLKVGVVSVVVLWALFRSMADAASSKGASAADDKKAVAALDTQYQAAVEKNDAATMDRILADDFVLVVGSGKVFAKADLLNEARSGRTVYEHQSDTEQTVRIWRDTAVVTAKLWENGTDNGKPFDKTLWFSDTYVLHSGWMAVCVRPGVAAAAQGAVREAGWPTVSS